MLTYAFVQSAIDMYDVDYGYTVLLGIGGTFVLGIGALAFGVLLMFLWFFFPRSKPFFRGESLNRETAGAGARRPVRLRALGRRRRLTDAVRRRLERRIRRAAASSDARSTPCAVATPGLTIAPPTVFRPAARAASARSASFQPRRAICRM